MNVQGVRVTVIMACHNSSSHLAEAVASILSQTMDHLELILIDDCSSDDTLEIANYYHKMDSRVSVISLKANVGPAAARNVGIHAARGLWVAILDSDDVAMPTRLDEQLKLANSDVHLVMVGSSSISIDKNGHTLIEHKYPTNHHQLVERLNSLGAFVPHSSIMYRADMVKRVGSFNPRYMQSEDYDLWLRMSEVGRIASIDKTLVKIRKHESNISNAEGGLSQLKFGFAACVCHFLRVHGRPDPSIESEEILWKHFLAWLDSRMVEEGIFERLKAWTDARTEYFAVQNKLRGILRFGVRLLSSGHTSAILREKFFGTSVPRRLAQEWMNR